MVVLGELEQKLKNACKRLPIPTLRILGVDSQENCCNIYTTKGLITIMVNKEAVTKDVVFAFLNHPNVKEFREVKLVGLEKTLELDTPIDIKLIGLPDRQMKLISELNNIYFVDLCKPSYNKLYKHCKTLENKSKEISFEDLSRLIKRKELLVALYMR